MNIVASINLVGITGIARRLVQDGALEEATARSAMDQAANAKIPLPQWFAEKKLVTAAQLAAANAVEFGMPLMDVSVFDASQNAMKLVSEELLKYQVLPLFKRGNRLFVGVSNPTQTRALDDIKFHTNLVVEPIWSTRTRSVAPWSSGRPAMLRLDLRSGTMTRGWATWTCRPVTRTWAPAGIPGSMPRATTRRW